MSQKPQIDIELIAVVVFVLVMVIGAIVILTKGKDEPGSPITEQNRLTQSLNSPESTQASSSERLVSKKDDIMLQYDNPPSMSLKENTDYMAVLKTSYGDIKIDLFEDKTPVTVNNFVFLSTEGFYNSTKSHRVIKDFMVQFGDPNTADPAKVNSYGTGGPGYRFNDEAFEGEYSRGVVAMANSGPNTNGSQFFIMHKDNPLPKNYVIFGKVIDNASLNVLDAIALVPVSTSRSGERSTPTLDIVITGVDILQTPKGAPSN